MIIPDRWAEAWIGAWNAADLDTLLAMYGEDIQLRSPFAKLYAENGSVRGKAALRSYWAEVMRRNPKIRLELVQVYGGHRSLAFQYRDEKGRNVIETVLFDDADMVSFETACIGKAR